MWCEVQRSRLFSEVTGLSAFIHKLRDISPGGASGSSSPRRSSVVPSRVIRAPSCGCRRAVCRSTARTRSPGVPGGGSPPLCVAAARITLPTSRLEMRSKLLGTSGCSLQTVDDDLDIRAEEGGGRQRQPQDAFLVPLRERGKAEPEVPHTELSAGHGPPSIDRESPTHPHEDLRRVLDLCNVLWRQL